MEEKYIILILQTEADVSRGIDRLEDLCVVDSNDELLLFDSLDEADFYRSEKAIDSRIIELPTY